MSKVNIETILEGMTLTEKYNAISVFLDSTFKVTNEAIPQMATNNPIMSNLVLQELKKIDEIITKDIESIRVSDIDITDITTKRNSDISAFVYSCMMMSNAYICSPSDAYRRLLEDLKAYGKAQKLEKVFPIEKRRARLHELENDIEATEQIISTLVEVDDIIAKAYENKVVELRREYNAIKETTYFKDMEEIQMESYAIIISRVSSIKERTRVKIQYLERVLGGDFE